MSIINVDNTVQSVLSFCTGMRGIERGIERSTSIRTVAYVEIESWVCWNMVKQMEQGLLAPAPVWTNLKTFPSQEFHGRIHGITGGYPCQPFSTAGKRKGTEDPRHLWPYIARHIAAIRPVWCFFENVEAHLTLGYREVRLELESMGYIVKTGIFSAAEAGAPHQRKRIFILAVENTSIERFKRSIGTAQRQGEFNGLSVTGAGKLGYSYSNGNEKGLGAGTDNGLTGKTKSQKEERERIRTESTSTSELAYSGNSGCITGGDNRQEGHLHTDIGVATENQPERNGWEHRTGKAGAAMAYPNGSRSGKDSQPTELRANGIKQSSLYCWNTKKEQNNKRRFDRWPAPPGQPQYEWEAPRTVESKLGTTVNGYNHREDLLRLAGNAVVEQTAEIAWRTLWGKI